MWLFSHFFPSSKHSQGCFGLWLAWPPGEMFQVRRPGQYRPRRSIPSPKVMWTCVWVARYLMTRWEKRCTLAGGQYPPWTAERMCMIITLLSHWLLLPSLTDCIRLLPLPVGWVWVYLSWGQRPPFCLHLFTMDMKGMLILTFESFGVYYMVGCEQRV